jgi:hypothetical protein
MKMSNKMNNIKQDKIETLRSKSIITYLFLFSSLLFTLVGLLLFNPILSISAQQDNTTTLSNTEIKKSIPHNAVGHESHQVVQFIEPLNNTLYKGIITFTSSIPIDVIAYHDVSKVADKLNKTAIKPWIVNGKPFAPATIMKNVTAGTVDFIGSGITTHIPYNQTYDVIYSIHAIPFNIK